MFSHLSSPRVRRHLVFTLPFAMWILADLFRPASAFADDLFRDRIAPILQQRCVGCHNDNDLDGELSLQSAEAFFKGGENGSIVDKRQPNESPLLDYVSGDDPEMPKDEKPLSREQVAWIKKWLAEGSPWPDGFRIDFQSNINRDWWSLKPVSKHKLAEGVNPIDFFVARKHAEHKLSFSTEADKRDLVRRLYYDLLGLPPTLEQVERFVKSKDPAAYQKLVDELLASKRYGERWARHWLDVVQYGETHGYDKDKPRMNAWPYRDYVIRSFNQDKPYARFVKEQLAGDVLFPESSDGIVATGFIASGPWDFIGHAEVPESKIDGQVARNLDRDNMVTSTMNTFCSLTVQCARCHNHKLDPVTMEEYYNLQAVFAALDRADRNYDLDPAVARRRSHLNLQRRKANADLKMIEELISRKKTPELKSLDDQIKRLRDRVAQSGLPKPNHKKSNRMGYHSQVARQQNTVKWVQVDLGQPTKVEQIVLAGAVEYGFDDFGFPHRFVVEGSLTSDFRESTVLLDHRDKDFPRPGNLPVVVKPPSPATLRYVRLTGTKLWNRRVKGAPKSNDWIFAIGEMAVIANQRVADIQSVDALDSIEARPGWSKSNLIDHLFGGHNLETRLGRKESPTNGYHSQFSNNPDMTKWVQLNLESAQPIDELRLYPAFPTDFKDTPGFGFPVRFKVELSNHPAFQDAKIVMDRTSADVPNPGLKPLVVKLNDLEKHQYIRITATKLWNRGDPGGNNHALAFAEIEVFAAGQNVAKNAKTVVSDSINSGRWHQKNLVDGFTSRLPVNKRIEYLVSVGRDNQLQANLEKLVRKRRELGQQVIGKALLERRKKAQVEITRVDKKMAELPKPSRVYAGTVHQGSGAFRGRAGLGPREVFVLHRGDVRKKKKPAVPGTVPFIDHASAIFELPENHHEGQRRVALANWIVRRDNPLTWRSIVNRIWQYHFGKGIVDTPNDFGRGGSLPSHPELLDWMAVEFRDGGKFIKKQSIKSLHRLICNSRTYRQTSKSDEFEKQDGGNQFLWRMERRRLSAEEIHDTVLQVAGILDLKMGGPSYQDFVIQRPEHSPHYEYHLHDPNDPATHRRAVYRFIVRSQPQPFLDTLNCADPSFSVPKRAETLTALQALGMLNNRFMVAMSERFAGKLGETHPERKEQIELGYRVLTGRNPSSYEMDQLEKFAGKHGMKNLCRVLFNLNEFIFVD